MVVVEVVRFPTVLVLLGFALGQVRAMLVEFLGLTLVD